MDLGIGDKYLQRCPGNRWGEWGSGGRVSSFPSVGELIYGDFWPGAGGGQKWEMIT